MQSACQSPDERSVDLLDVAVPLPVHQAYTYAVPPTLKAAVDVGKRVLVPFGRRRLTGYVLGTAHQAPRGLPVKDIIDVLDESPLFPKRMVAFFQWVSTYYLYPLGEVIQSALPSGLTIAEQSLYQLTPAGQDMLVQGELDETSRRFLRAMDGTARNFSALSKMNKGTLTRSKLKGWVAKGWVAQQTRLAGQRTRPKKLRFVKARSFDASKHRISSQRQTLLSALNARGSLSVQELKTIVPTADNLIRAMARDHQVSIEERTVYRDPLGAPISPDRPYDLTVEQRTAVKKIGPALGKGFQTFLLAGVTGSGKTEVYLHLAAQALGHQMSVLVLVPEIALISQIEGAFRARFGEKIALLHSGLSNGERYDQWLRIARNEIRIAIGARSAIFAPLDGIGLIIVDEEHDEAYKQEGALRYNARDLAVVRAQMDQAVAVIGSATPSIQSIYNVQIGKYKQVSLHERIDNRCLPEIIVQDLNQIKEEQGLRRFITPRLIEAMQVCLSRKEQVLLFLNRRGFANILVCGGCGDALKCDRCDISLTYHKGMNAYKCHYCGFSRAATSRCCNCGSLQIKRLGLGTEKVEAKMKSLFPQARVARMDRDTTRRKGAIIRILKSLREREIDILVGTQMVAKGHDYPHITLVGVICADLSLSMPDFRAGERTYQLLAQVAGRAGRGSSPGQVVLQTYNPHHFSIRAARHQDYAAFYGQEIGFRKALGYPPFSRIIQVRVNGKDKSRTAAHAKHIGHLSRRLQASCAEFSGLEVLGPVEAPLAKIANQYRWQLLIKGPKIRPLQHYIRELLYGEGAGKGAVVRKKDVSVTVDVDPLFLM